jgi:hypothetical protein
VRQCPACGAAVTGHANRRYCDETCKDAYRLAFGPRCSVGECGELVVGNGLCRKHYQRMKAGNPLEGDLPRRTGPYKGRQSKATYEERLVARSAPAPECKCGCGQTTTFDTGHGRYFAYLPGHYRRPAPYKNRDWLQAEYVEKLRTMEDIAAECGVTSVTVRRNLVANGFAIRPQAQALRLSGRSAGPNNPAWKGGTTPERQRLYKSQEWRGLVASVLERDGYVCQRCGDNGSSRANRLHAHHIELWADAPHRRTDPDNLVTLCKRCHQWVHSNENIDRLFLANPSA